MIPKPGHNCFIVGTISQRMITTAFRCQEHRPREHETVLIIVK